MSATLCGQCNQRVAMRGRPICTACEDAKSAAPVWVTRWRVRYGNYEPAEIDSTWPTEAEAEAQADELNRGGDGMWEVEKVVI